MAIDPVSGLPVPEPDPMAYAAEMQGPQLPTPNDFFARLAMQTGGQGPFGQFNVGHKVTGLEGLAALLSGFVNGKTRAAGQRIASVEDQNARARDAAKTLAQWRHDERMRETSANSALRNITASTAGGLEKVVDPETGKATLVPRSKAAGMEPAYPPKATPSTKNQDVKNGNAILTRAQKDPDISQFVTIRDTYGTAKQAASMGNSEGDIVLMRLTAKATDPTTGVREEEFKTFAGAQGRLARLGIKFTSDMIGQGMLTPVGRARLMATIQGIYDRKKKAYDRATEFYRKQAAAAGLDPNLVVRDFVGPEPPAAGHPDEQVTIIRNGVKGTISRKFVKPTDQVVP